MPFSGYLCIGCRNLIRELRGTLLEIGFRNADRKLGDADALPTLPEGFDRLGVFRAVLLFANRAKRLSRCTIQAQSWSRPYSSLARETFRLSYPLPDGSQIPVVRNPCTHQIVHRGKRGQRLLCSQQHCREQQCAQEEDSSSSHIHLLNLFLRSSERNL